MAVGRAATGAEGHNNRLHQQQQGGAIDNYSNGEDDQWSQWQRSRLDPSFVYIEYNILSLSNITNYIMLFSDHKFVFQTLSQNCAEGGSGRRLGSGTLRKSHIIVYCPTCLMILTKTRCYWPDLFYNILLLIISSNLQNQSWRLAMQSVCMSVNYNLFLSQTKSENTPKSMNQCLELPNMLYNCPYRVYKSTSSQEVDKSDLFRYSCWIH